MQYMGSKNRVAKILLAVIERERKPGQTWVEPFVGGANMIDKVPGPRIGNDSHKYLIAMWKALQTGWIPPTEISKEMYYNVKVNQETYPPELVGFVGFLCSFGSKWWGGYAFNNRGDNYAERGSRVLVKQATRLKDVVFTCENYLDMEIPTESLIYCDPPYEGTTKYKDKFDHISFWEWCRKMTREGHTVFISEYHAPEDFICVAEIKHKTILDKNSNYERIEKLFRYSTKNN